MQSFTKVDNREQAVYKASAQHMVVSLQNKLESAT